LNILPLVFILQSRISRTLSLLIQTGGLSYRLRDRQTHENAMVKRKAPARGGIPVINLTRVAQKATAAEIVEFVEPPLSLKNRLIWELRADKARRCDPRATSDAAGSAVPLERDATIISLVDDSEEDDEVRVKDEPGLATRAEQHCIYWWSVNYLATLFPVYLTAPVVLPPCIAC
jgi:hypothetical protein